MSALVLMRMVLRHVRMDITGMLRMRVLLMGTMARRGLAAESLLEPARGSGADIMGAAMGIMDAVMDMVTVAPMTIVAVMGTDAVMPAMAMDTLHTDAAAMAVDITAATVAASTEAVVSMAVVTVAADGSFMD